MKIWLTSQSWLKINKTFSLFLKCFTPPSAGFFIYTTLVELYINRWNVSSVFLTLGTGFLANATFCVLTTLVLLTVVVAGVTIEFIFAVLFSFVTAFSC